MKISLSRVALLGCIILPLTSVAADTNTAWSLQKHHDIIKPYAQSAAMTNDKAQKATLREAGEKYVMQIRAHMLGIKQEPYTKPSNDWTLAKHFEIVSSYLKASTNIKNEKNKKTLHLSAEKHIKDARAGVSVVTPSLTVMATK